MKRRNLAAVTAVATALAVVPAAGAMAASMSNDGRTTLPGSSALHANGLRIQSVAPAAQQVSFTLQLPMRNQQLAQRLAAAGVVMSPAQYRARFAPSPQQMRRLTHWATSQGFAVTQVSRDSGQVMARASVGHVNHAFDVRMHRASLHGARGLTVDRAPSVPRALGLTGVAGLNSVRYAHPDHLTKNQVVRIAAARAPLMHTGGVSGHLRPLAAGTDGSTACAPYWGSHLYPKSTKYRVESNDLCGYKPADLQTMYRSNAYAGTRAKLGILLWDNNPSELTYTNQYMKKYGFAQLPASRYKTVLARYSNNPSCSGAQSEQDLDVQSSHAIAPGASITYYGAASCSDTDLTKMLQKAVDQHAVSTLSMSFGFPTDQGMTAAQKAAWDRPLLQASLTGISVFASSGDSGDNSRIEGGDGKPHIGYPASSAYLTAVGGTSVGMRKGGGFAALAGWEDGFYLQASSTSTTFPDVTSQEPVYGGGGGVSQASKQPAWQRGHSGGYSSTMRVVPDIAAVADPFTGYTVHTKDTSTGKVVYQPIGGTSLASPVTAALVGLGKTVNRARLGNVAPKLYKLAGTSAIKDVNAPNSAGVYYPMAPTSGLVIGFDTHHQSLVTKKGFDNVTGVGTPNGAAFIKAIK